MFTFFFPVRKVLSNNRSWIIISTFIFFICLSLFSYAAPFVLPEAAEQPVDNQFDQLMGVFDFILDAPPAISALMVFMNNFLSMAQMLLLGFIAGISPLITLGLNGALVGVIFSISAEQGTSLLPLIIYGILPHGIFELPAFFICGALGLKFGYHCTASPLPGKSRLQSYRFIWKETIAVLPLIVLLLFAAALIEIFITSQLIEMVL
ncbi:MAG: stage II sporulation protein M [Bacillota bacterium]